MNRGLRHGDRDRLLRLRRRPVEARWNSGPFCRLQAEGLAQGAPLARPSGMVSLYREWTITPLGIELLEEARNS